MTDTPFATQVDEAIKEYAIEKDGVRTLEIPEDKEVSESVLYAAQTELRHRNTQSAYTRANQEAKKYKTVSEQLTNNLIEVSTAHISLEQHQELDRLKLSDPDEWRNKLDQYEKEAKQKSQAKVDEAIKAGDEMSEVEFRQLQMQSFTEQTGITLTDDVINNELPASYMASLNNGSIDFNEFLNRAEEFLTKGKTIANTSKTDAELLEKQEKNLSKAPGANQPSAQAEEGDVTETYRNTIF